MRVALVSLKNFSNGVRASDMDALIAFLFVLIQAQCLVNTVNCVGVMGKGVALEFRRRFPAMFEEYHRICDAGTLRPGQILPYRKGQPWILNFAVKDDWKHPSKIEWVESCLNKFVASYRKLEIRSVAMPWLGAMNGRLEWNQVHSLIHSYLSAVGEVVGKILWMPARDLSELALGVWSFFLISSVAKLPPCSRCLLTLHFTFYIFNF